MSSSTQTSSDSGQLSLTSSLMEIYDQTGPDFYIKVMEKNQRKIMACYLRLKEEISLGLFIKTFPPRLNVREILSITEFELLFQTEVEDKATLSTNFLVANAEIIKRCLSPWCHKKEYQIILLLLDQFENVPKSSEERVFNRLFDVYETLFHSKYELGDQR